VIANRPEGRGLADALADRLGAKVVMFDNFPVEYDGQVSFDRLVLDNIHWLIADKP
jgi:nucleoside-diphosphate-sugar epimerase